MTTPARSFEACPPLESQSVTSIGSLQCSNLLSLRLIQRKIQYLSETPRLQCYTYHQLYKSMSRCLLLHTSGLRLFILKRPFILSRFRWSCNLTPSLHARPQSWAWLTPERRPSVLVQSMLATNAGGRRRRCANFASVWDANLSDGRSVQCDGDKPLCRRCYLNGTHCTYTPHKSRNQCPCAGQGEETRGESSVPDVFVFADRKLDSHLSQDLS